MQFELRGQQQEASGRHPGLVKRRVKHRNKGPKPGTDPVYMKPIQITFILNLQPTLQHFGAAAPHEDRIIVHDDIPFC